MSKNFNLSYGLTARFSTQITGDSNPNRAPVAHYPSPILNLKSKIF